MQTSNEGNLLEIIDLAHSLRQEQLFISNEQNTFIKLNESLLTNTLHASQLAWICAQQRQNLNNLILSKPDNGPSLCCQRANLLENTKFVDAHKAKGLKYQHMLVYVELFNYLHRSPYLLAQCLAIGDQVNRITPEQINSVVQTIATGLYGNAIHSKDIEMILKMLQELIEIQIIPSENPRRMLRHGSCAFSRLYHRLHESLFSAKLFLTAALHEPVMKVLIEDEFILDTDPIKAIFNHSSKERLKKFGQEGTPEYDEKVKKFRIDTINSLYILTNKFISALTMNWSLFPSTLRWLIQTMCYLLKRSQATDKDINAILTDMVFTHFICPAVVSPDLYGISDAAISENARFNLIQIGQILQMLALIKYQDVEQKLLELYDKFEHNVVSDLLEQLVPHAFDVGTAGTVTMPPYQDDIGRTSVLVTQSELNILVDFLRSVLESDGLIVSGEDRRKLGDILDLLPDKWESMINSNGDSLQHDITSSNSKTKQSLINLGKSTKTKLAKTITLNVGNLVDLDDAQTTNATNNYANGQSNYSHLNNNNNNNFMNNNNLNYDEYEQVLIVPINIGDGSKFQLLSEEAVLNMNNISNINEPGLTEKNVEGHDRKKMEENAAMDEVEAVLRTGHQKHTRFSLSHDDADLEVVSEAPSNHSVTSSMELEENDQNDNLSDMVSANVSGRGTPNISGRDTPSSQVTEGENRVPQIPTPQMAKILNKARSDIEDKFCKFEIKKLIEGDETISIISDTWSTDVLASDSETLESSDRDRNFSTPLIPSAVILPGDNNFDPLSGTGSQLRNNNLDVSETQSESAWSTDVLASDSEKMTEIDTDDNQSIAAKSDITDAGRSEGDPARDPDLLPGGRAPDSPFFSPRSNSSSISRLPDSPMYTPRTHFSRNHDDNRSLTNSITAPALRHGIRDSIDRNAYYTHLSSVTQPSYNCHDGGAIGGSQAEDDFFNHSASSAQQRSHGSNLLSVSAVAAASNAASMISNSSAHHTNSSRNHNKLHPNVGDTSDFYSTPPAPADDNTGRGQQRRRHHHHHHHHQHNPINNHNHNILLTHQNIRDNNIGNNTSIDMHHQQQPQSHLSVFKPSNNLLEMFNREQKINTDLKKNSTYGYNYQRVYNTPEISPSRHHHTKLHTVETVVKSSTNIINPFIEDDSHSNNSAVSKERCQNAITNNNNNDIGRSSSPIVHREDANNDIGVSGSILSNYEMPQLSSSNEINEELNDSHVEHRRISLDQRNASFDGRRNGIIDYTTKNSTNNTNSFISATTSTNTSSTMITARRHQQTMSAYENHEIILRRDKMSTSYSMPNNILLQTTTAAATTSSSSTSLNENQQPNTTDVISNAVTDDAKNQQQNSIDNVLLLRTQSLTLNEVRNINNINNNTNNDNNNLVVNNNNNNNLIHADLIPPPTQLTMKPNKCTGAIPKSISFDSSADKDVLQHLRYNNNNNSNNNNNHINSTSIPGQSGGFFNKIKQGFRNRRSNKFRTIGHDEHSNNNHGNIINDFMHYNHLQQRLKIGGGGGGDADQINKLILNKNDLNNGVDGNGSNNYDTSDDILAKYRRKASSSSDATNSDSTSNNSSSLKSRSSQSDGIIDQRMQNGITYVEDKFYCFNNTKRKLRIVLSSTDLHTSDFRHSCCDNKSSPLLIYLQIQLAQALNLQNLQQISYVSEAIRSLNNFDYNEHQKLINELQKDLIKRQSYLQYLIRYRQNLLSALENIEHFEDRLQNDRDMCNRYLIIVCIRMFLEKREQMIIKFQNEFSNLTILDEKIDLLDEFMGKLMEELRRDGIIQGMADWQLHEARISIERVLLQRLYWLVMFPNDDGDLSRDQVLREHIRKLSRIITPSHTALRIPQMYMVEAPWPFAQQQIAYISAYKTPRDKVQCVVRCITCIMNLLSMASDHVPSADDLTPVLIYVIIKANPPYLLSTIEYVNCFIGDKLEGEVLYWWTQFCSAVTFIKTMDYRD